MIETIIPIVVLILSVILHELAHGYAANWLGDPTARLAGRLTLNPVRHIDPLGSIIIPGFLLLTGAGFLFGWAKPVPYNPYNLKNQRWGEAFVAAAGPLTNVLLAIVFALLVRAGATLGLSPAFLDIANFIVLINVVLALFNAIPIPPLDGSKVLTALLPYHLAQKYQAFGGVIQRLGFVGMFLVLFVFIQLLAQPFGKLVFAIHTLLVGG